MKKYIKLGYNVELTVSFDDMSDKESDKLTKRINRLAKIFLKETGGNMEPEIWDDLEIKTKIKTVVKEA
jgi:hypothetical protein